MSPNEKLFPYLCIDFNEYLFDVAAIPDYERWADLFGACRSVYVSHAFRVFELFEAVEDDIRNKKRELKKKLAKAQKPQTFDEPAEANFSLATAMDETVIK